MPDEEAVVNDSIANGAITDKAGVAGEKRRFSSLLRMCQTSIGLRLDTAF